MENRKTKSISKIVHLHMILLMMVLMIGLTPADNLMAKISGEVTVEISLPTVQCGMCQRTIDKALDKVKGIKDYSIDIGNKKATVTYDDAVTTLTKIEKAISKAGYAANDTEADKKAYDKLDDCCKVQ